MGVDGVYHRKFSFSGRRGRGGRPGFPCARPPSRGDYDTNTENELQNQNTGSGVSGPPLAGYVKAATVTRIDDATAPRTTAIRIPVCHSRRSLLSDCRSALVATCDMCASSLERRSPTFPPPRPPLPGLGSPGGSAVSPGKGGVPSHDECRAAAEPRRRGPLSLEGVLCETRSGRRVLRHPHPVPLPRAGEGTIGARPRLSRPLSLEGGGTGWGWTAFTTASSASAWRPGRGGRPGFPCARPPGRGTPPGPAPGAGPCRSAGPRRPPGRGPRTA